MGVWRWLGNIRASWCVSELRTGMTFDGLPETTTGFKLTLGKGIGLFVLDRAVSKRVEKGVVQWPNQLLRDR